MQRLVDHRVLRQRNMEPQDSSSSFEGAGEVREPVHTTAGDYDSVSRRYRGSAGMTSEKSSDDAR
jgi:hypothetical protein